MIYEEQYTTITGTGYVTIKIQLFKDFIPCIEDIPSPFKHATVGLPPELNKETYECVNIHCYIEKDEQSKINMNTSESPRFIFDETITKFIEKTWKDKVLVEVERIHCNHFEQQIKYIIGSKPQS